LVAQYGTPEQNPAFWASISPNSYLKDLSGPVQLHHGTADESVPYDFSVTLDKEIRQAGKYVEFYTYPDDNHNLSGNLGIALQRSVAFFDKYVKNIP
jgi:dipeptidyl aminopeptidase/acylaminoacyl peptidase